MSALNSPPDSSLFTISPDQKAKYEIQFKKICPTGDFVGGQQARELMLQSGLPPQVLAHIWNLADVDADGKMDINEFSIALHLIALKMKGVELPPTLPQSLKVLVEPPPFAAFNNEPSINNAPLKTSTSATKIASPTSNNIQQRLGSMGDLPSIKTMAGKSVPSPITSAAEWAIPQNSKLKYTQIFNSHDRQRTGFLTGIQARNILLESKLPQTILALIWNLSDVDADGRLTCEEFVLAMHLVDKAKRNEPLPQKLPGDLIPPSYRRGSGTLSHTSSLDDTSEHNDLSSMSKSSFEDKRRENYEKGQAELDRRRAALQEQERRAREERERKEREENARKEKERLEAERRRQEEIEMQKQKLREQELEREEQKRRQQEVRELARKEMERQRQREVEQARRSELLAQRSRLMEEVQKLKSRKKTLVIEHEQVDKNLVERKAAAQSSRDKVVRIKTEIDGMRIKRDQILAKQSQIKVQMKSLTEKQLFVEQEKVRLAAQLKSLIANTSNGVNPEQQLTTFTSILQAKQSQINQLRSQLERMEQEFKTKKEDVINNKQELEKLKRNFQEKRREALKFSDKLEDKRIEAEKVRDGKAQSKFAADSDVAWGQEVPTNFEWPSTTTAAVVEEKRGVSPVNVSTVRTKFRYRCVFEFEARNSDEITIKPGDLIMVDTSACSEEGWLSGEINGKIGWFPKDYAVCEENDQQEQQQTDSQQVTTNEMISATPADSGAIREAKALYDWSSTEAGHLSFYKDDRIRISQQQDSWCFGELLDASGQVTASGWFPESYVQMDGVTGAVGDGIGGDVSSQYYISLYAFETVEPGDLGFDVNELIKVEKQDGDWWTGVIVDKTSGQENANRRGIFPSNFVGPASAADIPKTISAASSNADASNKNQTNAAPSPKPHQPLDRKESESITDSPKPSKKSKAKKQVEIVQAVAAYTSTGKEQLSLEVGQLIQVRKKTQTGWWEGELQAKGKKKQVGWFPASYVKPLGAAGPAASSSGPVAPTSNPIPDPTAKIGADEPEIERVQALYPFNAQRDDEISFNKDDIIRVLSKTDPTWWRGHNTRTDAIGLFPSNHVQVISKNDQTKSEDSSAPTYDYVADDDVFYSSNLSNHSDDKTVTEFVNDRYDYDSFENDEDYQDNYELNDNDSFDDDDFFSDDDDNDQNIPKQLEQAQSVQDVSMKTKRENLIYELICSEYDYINDLYFIIENYKTRIEDSKLLSKNDFDLIFDQIQLIYDTNLSFYSDLTKRLQDSSDELRFCDILLYHQSKMLPCYQRFFSNQIQASNRFQNLVETDSRFDKLLKQISMDTKSHLPLSSYLIKPMQRITKYPLLIEKILKCTPNTHTDYVDCTQALEFAKKFCTDINETCRKTDNFDKLHWVQKKVLMPLKTIRRPIDFNSETQFLGPRTLIRAGGLVKTNSSRILVGFLFNDFFMLVRPTKHLKLNEFANIFQNKRALDCTYTLYRKPWMLDEFQIANVMDFESQINPGTFRLKLEKGSLSLRGYSYNDCKHWLNDLYKAQRHYSDILTKMKKVPIHIGKPSIGTLFLTVNEAWNFHSHHSCLDLQCEVFIGRDWREPSSKPFRTSIVSPSSFIWKSTQNLSTISKRSSSNKASTLMVKWDKSTKFSLTNIKGEYLMFRCLDVNPFIPKRCLFECKIRMEELLEECQNNYGVLQKIMQLNIPLHGLKTLNNNIVHSETRPTLLIHYQIILNQN